jgi:YggT family protein
MSMRVVSFLLETVFYLLIGASLLRAYMNWLRISMTAQPGTFVMALTDWLVKPLRRILPQALARSKIDSASLVSAALLSLLYALLAALLLGWFADDLPLLAVLAFAVKVVLRVVLQVLTILVFAYVIMSWVQPGSYGHGLLSRLVEPPLAPLRRMVPMIGGVDLSAMALLLLLQVGLMFLG